MTVQSRSVLPYECRQVYHPWHRDCLPAASMLGKPCFRESFKIYFVLYGISTLYKLKSVKSLQQFVEILRRYFSDTIRSTIFLGFHGVFFMPALCSGRRISGHISYYKLFLHILCVTYPAILIERKQRRGPLALYMANLAVEVLFKMATQRKLVFPLHNGEILLFSIASSIYTYMLKINDKHKHNSLLFGVMKFLIGEDECASSLPKIQEEKARQRRNFWNSLLDNFPNRNQPTCTHRYHCALHVALGFFKRFFIGIIIQLLLHFISSPVRFLRNPLIFFRSLNRNHLSLGQFFGFYCAIYRTISCLLRQFLKEDKPLHGLFAGYFAGFSMIFFKNSTLAMYMTAKLIESLYFKYSHDGYVPVLKWFDSLLYAVSTALVFHAAIVEPQAIRPAYYRFLERLTGGHFNEVNRPLMDCFGTGASKLFPNYKLPSAN